MTSYQMTLLEHNSMATTAASQTPSSSPKDSDEASPVVSISLADANDASIPSLSITSAVNMSPSPRATLKTDRPISVLFADESIVVVRKPPYLRSVPGVVRASSADGVGDETKNFVSAQTYFMRAMMSAFYDTDISVPPGHRRQVVALLASIMATHHHDVPTANSATYFCSQRIQLTISLRNAMLLGRKNRGPAAEASGEAGPARRVDSRFSSSLSSVPRKSGAFTRYCGRQVSRLGPVMVSCLHMMGNDENGNEKRTEATTMVKHGGYVDTQIHDFARLLHCALVSRTEIIEKADETRKKRRTNDVDSALGQLMAMEFEDGRKKDQDRASPGL
mmetsp:Transcript_939/g.1838  ORF Transcript_939/g.1838 Transcript_939/m.1838 type:complete len:334 (-) Transcript_939:796-1797(-)